MCTYAEMWGGSWGRTGKRIWAAIKVNDRPYKYGGDDERTSIQKLDMRDVRSIESTYPGNICYLTLGSDLIYCRYCLSTGQAKKILPSWDSNPGLLPSDFRFQISDISCIGQRPNH